jgi:hypothetical protein
VDLIFLPDVLQHTPYIIIFKDSECGQNWLHIVHFFWGMISLSQCTVSYLCDMLRKLTKRVPLCKYHVYALHIQRLGQYRPCHHSYNCPMLEHAENNEKFILWWDQKIAGPHWLQIYNAILMSIFPGESDKNWMCSDCPSQKVPKLKKKKRLRLLYRKEL